MNPSGNSASQRVETGDDARHDRFRQPHARPGRHRPFGEQPGRVAGAEFGERVDALGGDGQGRAAGGEHAQVRDDGDEVGHEPGHGLDQVLAVVQDQQARRLPEHLGDARPQVGPSLGGQDPAAGDGVADAEDGPDLGRDVFGRGDAGQFDDADGRLGRLPGEGVRQPGLADPAGADDGHDPGAGQQGAQPFGVAVAADQRGRVVAHPLPDGVVEGEQGAVRALEDLAGVGAETVPQVSPVPFVTGQRRRCPPGGGLAAQQVGQE